MSNTNAAQANAHHDLSGAEGREKLTSLIKDAHICMMATQAEDGSIDARPMAVQQANDFAATGTLWFLTAAASEKVGELEHDRHITLAFAEPKAHSYVTLKGTGSVSRDKAKIHDLWNTFYKAWFPNGEDDPNIAVLRVDIHSADYWDSNSNRLIFFAKYAIAAATKGAMPVGEAGHVTV